MRSSSCAPKHLLPLLRNRPVANSPACPTVNLAVAMAQKPGIKVGLVDADVYGPSIPTMLNLTGAEEPPVNGGVRLLVWRGIISRMPMTPHGGIRSIERRADLACGRARLQPGK